MRLQPQPPRTCISNSNTMSVFPVKEEMHFTHTHSGFPACADVLWLPVFGINVRGGEYLEKLYWNASPSCMELSHPYLWLCPECLMPPASLHSLPSCFAVGFTRPQNAGFPAAGVCMWWAALVASSLVEGGKKKGTKTGYPSIFSVLSVFFNALTSLYQYLAVPNPTH